MIKVSRIDGDKDKKKDDIILQISKKYLSLHPLNSNEGLNR